jgi:hypothetical protein
MMIDVIAISATYAYSTFMADYTSAFYSRSTPAPARHQAGFRVGLRAAQGGDGSVDGHANLAAVPVNALLKLFQYIRRLFALYPKTQNCFFPRHSFSILS